MYIEKENTEKSPAFLPGLVMDNIKFSSRYKNSISYKPKIFQCIFDIHHFRRGTVFYLRVLFLGFVVVFPHFKPAHPLDLRNVACMHIYAKVILNIFFDILISGVFVAPVWKESFGQVSPFAMSMGMPVAGYNIGALNEIIDDSSLLAASEDSDQLSDILVGLLDDYDRCVKIGKRNQRRAHELFGVQQMVDDYYKLYNELLEAKGNG